MAPPACLILIAEDEPPLADLVAEVVQELGWTPLIAHDGLQALGLAREHRPALLITDLMMPHLTGAQLIATLRADATARDAAPAELRIILMTAAGESAAGAAGADAVLLKPFDLGALEAVLRALLPA